MWLDEDRPDYMPPMWLSGGFVPESPRGVYWWLLSGPPSVAAAVILLVIFNAPTWILLIGVVALIVQCVQAIVYVPRARRAMAEEKQFLAQSNEDRSGRLGA